MAAAAEEPLRDISSAMSPATSGVENEVPSQRAMPSKVCLSRPFRRLAVGVKAGGIGVDHALPKRVHVHPVTVIAEPGPVLLVGPEGPHRDRPVEGRGPELPVRTVVARRRDQGDVAVPPAELAEGERGPVVTGVGSSGKADDVRRLLLDELLELADDHVLEFATGLAEVIVDVHGGGRRHAPRDAGYEGPVAGVLRDARQAAWPGGSSGSSSPVTPASHGHRAVSRSCSRPVSLMPSRAP